MKKKGISMIKTEEQELEYQMNLAIQSNDGWLTYWYGSQLQHIRQLREESIKHTKELQQKLDSLKEECEEKWKWKVEKYKLNLKFKQI